MRYVDVLAHQSRRVVSVDVLRGFSLVSILGDGGTILALADMAHGKRPVITAIGGFLDVQFQHSAWEGFTFYDFVFPLLIFIVGVSIVLSLQPLVESDGRLSAHLRVWRRTLLLYGLGVIYYGGVRHGWANIHWVGVLQRIAICYLFTSVMFLNFNLRGLIAAFVVLLVGYWAVMTFVPVPGIGAGNFAPDQNLADWIDANYLPGWLWDQTRDPEGLLSTLPAIASCLLGVFAGLILRDISLKPQQKSLSLIGAGVLLIIGGHLWAILQFPIIKDIWTSSFVLVAGGYSAILLGVMHQVVDVWGQRRWATIFVWIGSNAILLYFVDGFVTQRIATHLVRGDIGQFFDQLVTKGTGLFVANLVGLGIVVLLARFLYRRQNFLRV